MGSIPESEDPLSEGMATHSGILSWRIPWREEPGGLEGHSVTKSWTLLKQLGTRYIVVLDNFWHFL